MNSLTTAGKHTHYVLGWSVYMGKVETEGGLGNRL